MNKIFKVIWNHATQTFVVVSELTKSNGKSSSTTDSRVEPSKALLAISLAGAALLGSAQAMAATATTPLTDSTGTALTSGGENLYIITDTSSTGTGDGIAIGYNAIATDSGNTGSAVAIGKGSSAIDMSTIAIGTGSTASSAFATAIGTGTVASGSNATAVGSGASASNLATAIGVRANASGGSSLAMGDGANATASNAVAIGVNSTASGFSSYAGGAFSSALASYTVALGSTANASAANSVAIGNTAGASGESSVALGGATRASGERAIAIGRSTWSTANRSTAIGQGVTAAGDYSVALGVRAETATTATSGIAIGNGTIASAANTTVLGTSANATTSATNSNVIGKGALSNSTNSTIIGTNASVAASNSGESIAIGSNATIAGSGTGFAVAIGNNATTNGINSMALGRSSYTSGQSSIAVGTFANASSNYAIATGMNSTASAENSIATGHFANATNSSAIATGTNSTASGSDSIAMGTKANATSSNATAMGANASATASAATALGNDAAASGVNSVAINGAATGQASVALGNTSKALDNYVIAIGNDATVDAGSVSSIAIGNSTAITGADSIAIGNTSYALAANATALGANAIVQTEQNVALGANSTDDKALARIDTATVGGITYSGFAGYDTAVGVVSVGANGKERQIINVAPGNISATSTDAINGSQLYAVADILGNVANSTVAALGDNVTLNPNGTFSVSYNLTGTDPSNSTATETEYTSVGDALTALSTAVNQPLTFKGDEGTTTQELGSTLNIVAGNATDTSTRNVKTNVTAAGQLEISFSDKPTFTNVTVEDTLTVGPVTINQTGIDAGNTTITNVAPGTNATDAVNLSQLNATKTEVTSVNGTVAVTTSTGANGQTIYNVEVDSDTLNASKSVVTAGNQTSITTSTNADGSTNYQVDVNVSNVTANPNGTVSSNGTGLVSAADVATAINNSGFTLKSSATDGTKVSGTDEIINPGDVIDMVAGKNMNVTQAAGGRIIYATADKVEFTNVNVTSSLPTTEINVGEKDAKKSTNLLDLATAETNTPNAVVTAKDLANYGWVVATPDNGYDAAVKSANTVNFIGDNHISVTGANNATTGTYDVKIELADAGAISFVEDNTGTTPTNTGAVKAGDEDGNNPTGFVSAKTVADAINGSGWRTNSTTATGTATETLVNPGEQVNFEAGKNMVVTQKVEKDANGADVISYTYATADDVTFNSTTVGGQDTYKDAEGNPVTKNEKGDFVDAEGNVIDPADVTTVNNSPITIGTTPEGNNVIANLTKTLPDTTSVGDNPTEKAPITAEEAQNIADKAGNNAATLGDVLNAGWNLKVNNEDVDFVKPYDTVAFVNGTGTTARVEFKDGVQSNITFDVNVDNKTTEITYADAAGNTVTKVGDKFYNPADLNADGTPKADAKPVENVVSRISAILPTTTVDGKQVGGDISFGDTTTANVTTNEAGDIIVNVNTGTSSVSNGKTTDKDGNIIPAGKAVVTEGDTDKVATLGDIINTINNVYHSVNSTTVAGTNGESTYVKNADSQINAGDTVNYNAGQNIKISGKGDTIEIATTENVTFSNAVVNQTLSLGDVTKPGAPVVNMTAVNASTPVGVENGDITPAVNMGGATFTNLAPNLPTTVSTGNASTSTTSQAAPTVTPEQMTNAATLGDVLNAGWNLQENGTAKDFVKPYDTVNFVNGAGTTANITTDGNVSNVTYNVNVDNQTTEITYTNAAGDTIYKLADGTYNTSADGKGTTVAEGDISGSQVSAKTSPLTNNVDGTVNTPANPKSLATAGDVANAINNSGFTLTTSASAGEVSGTSKELVKPGKTVTVDAGKNISVTQNAGTITVATKKDVEFDSVKAGPVTINSSGINAGGTKITNVAAGTADTDAVNVGQLKQVAGDIHNKINRNNKDLRAGIAGANAAAGLPQVYIPGKSMVAASAGTFKGQSAVAVGYSRASDNGKLILKLQGNANTRGDIGGSVGVGYQW
ncbi:YadA-like family protein [uncultured Actinobacillus sp.]|uniref:ESPR-type extended signal peptide-containing protein n=1 Tax=uncultured Actinobacillus sp. TaxID=417616 RepID=UPI0025EEE23D|nr:YadA-like family protein [uncultured Actinobacillus sp.]